MTLWRWLRWVVGNASPLCSAGGQHEWILEEVTPFYGKHSAYRFCTKCGKVRFP